MSNVNDENDPTQDDELRPSDLYKSSDMRSMLFWLGVVLCLMYFAHRFKDHERALGFTVLAVMALFAIWLVRKLYRGTLAAESSTRQVSGGPAPGRPLSKHDKDAFSEIVRMYHKTGKDSTP